MTNEAIPLFKLDGDRLTRLETEADCLRTASANLPLGSYTTLRTYQGLTFLRLDAHLDRLQESAHMAGKPVSLDRRAIRQALAQAVAQAGYPESRLRLTLILDDSTDEADCCPAQSGDLFIALEPFHGHDPSLYEHGIRCVTVGLRRQRPRAKMTDFFRPSRQVYARLPPGIYEGLMVDENGTVLEGLTSNFFALYRGSLWTAARGVLHGITRGLVLEVAAELLPICLEPVRLGQIADLDEAFITSSSREIMPVIEIDGVPIGGGRPGPQTRRLLRRYRARVAHDVAPPV